MSEVPRLGTELWAIAEAGRKPAGTLSRRSALEVSRWHGTKPIPPVWLTMPVSTQCY